MKIIVLVSIEVPWIGGTKSFFFPVLEFQRFKGDPLDMVLKSMGVSANDYARWLENDGRVRCMATTKKGKQCSAYSSLKRIDDPREWVKSESNGGYCWMHGGEI